MMQSDASDDGLLQVQPPPLLPTTKPTSSTPKVILTFHTTGTEDVELYQVFKEPLQWLDRDLDIYRELRLSGLPGSSYKDCYSHNTLDIPALAVVLYLKDCISHGGVNRLLQAQEYFSKPPWKLHHSEWVCGNEDNAIQYYVLTLDRPLYSVKAASTERMRIMRYITHKRWADSVQLYQLLLGTQPSILKRDFCLFTIDQYTDYDVQFALKRLPRGIIPKKTRKAEISITVEDIGGLVALLPHTCYRISESRWCTRDLDGHKLYLDVLKTKKRPRSVSPSKLHRPMQPTFSVFNPSSSSRTLSESVNSKLSPGVFSPKQRSQSALGGVLSTSKAKEEKDTAKRSSSLSRDVADGVSWSKLTAYERYITTPVGPVNLSSGTEPSLDSPDSGVFTGNEHVADDEVFGAANSGKQSKSWLDQYVRKLSSSSRKHSSGISKRRRSKEALVSDTTSCDEEVDSVFTPPVIDHTKYFLNRSFDQSKLSEALRTSSLPFQRPRSASFGKNNSTELKLHQPVNTRHYGWRPGGSEAFPQQYTTFGRTNGRWRLASQTGEGDCADTDVIVENDPDPVSSFTQSAKTNTKIPDFTPSAKTTSKTNEDVVLSSATEAKDKESQSESGKTSQPQTGDEEDSSENDQHLLYDSLLLRKIYMKGLKQKLDSENIASKNIATHKPESADEGEPNGDGTRTLGEFLNKGKDVDDMLLRLDLGNKDLPDVVRSNTSLHDTSTEREGGPDDEMESFSRSCSGRRVRFNDTLSTHVYDAEQSEDEGTSQGSRHGTASSVRSQQDYNSVRSHQGSGNVQSHQGSNSAQSYQGSNSAQSHQDYNSVRSHQGSGNVHSHQGSNSAQSYQGSNSAQSHQGCNSEKSKQDYDSAQSHQDYNSVRSHQDYNSVRSHQGSGNVQSQEQVLTKYSNEDWQNLKLNATVGFYI